MSRIITYTNPVINPTQREPLDSRQVKNNAGGFVYTVDDWERLKRFLIRGSDGGTYYVAERKLTRDNAACVERCIHVDGPRTVQIIAEISDAGRAPKNTPAIFALAMCMKLGDDTTRRAARSAVPAVCRTGTHIFELATAVDAFGGWGRGTQRAFADWYNVQDRDSVALQLVKYRQRYGWTHRDIFRLAKPGKFHGVEHGDLIAWAVGKGSEHVHPLLDAFERVQRVETINEVVSLITGENLPRETIPTKWLNDAAVWDALLHAGKHGMPITALIRNLGKMTAVGLLKPNSDAAGFVRDKISDVTTIQHGRVHPMTSLIARGIYGQGHGDKGKLTWQPVQTIMTALECAFYAGFATIVPTNKRWLLALDVSRSMASPIAGTGISCCEASAAFAMVTARTEPNHYIMGFTGNFRRLDITSTSSLASAMSNARDNTFGATDCSLPMRWAQSTETPVDVFVVLTDNETWAGNIHPVQALRAYRRRMNIPAKLVVVGMTATEFTIADPDDAGSLDVVGFDALVPSIMADFVRASIAPN